MDQVFNDLTGQGDHGEIDARGPWNEGEPWQFVESPALQAMRNGRWRRFRRKRSHLCGELRSCGDGLDAGIAGRSAPRHSARREAAPESAAEDGEDRAFRRSCSGCSSSICRKRRSRLPGSTSASACSARNARAKPCKGMMGLIEEGEEVMAETKEQG